MKYGIVNCDIYTGEQVLFDKAIIVDGEEIEAIVDLDKVPGEIGVVDLKGLNIAPGFIDLQVNGGGGYLFNDSPTEECILKMYDAHKRFGTTNFLPTLITTSIDKMLQAIHSVRTSITRRECGVLGLHMEGPYINVARAGVHDKRDIRIVSISELEMLIRSGQNIIKMFTVAPEVVEEEHIRFLTQNGVVVSAGHSDASYEKAMESFNWGISNVTHIFNAMSQFSSREPGLVGAALDSTKVWAGIIVDGLHVHFASVRICKKAKGRRLVLVTDAMPPVGSEIPEFKLGELRVLHKNGKCMTEDGTLAGSVLDMATAVRNCVQKVGIPMDEALRMASTYPAEIIGLDDRLGKIRPGYLANMVIFNNQLVVDGIVSYGKYEPFAQ